MMRAEALVFHEKDNVAISLCNLKRGQTVKLQLGGRHLEVTARDNIPFGHKLAIRDIYNGKEIIKYGMPIGRATKHIKKGEHVHVHNVEGLRFPSRNTN